MKNTAKELREIAKSVTLHRVSLPEQETLNEFYQNYGSEGIEKLIEETAGKKTMPDFKAENNAEEIKETEIVPLQKQVQSEQKGNTSSLEIIHDAKFLWQGRDNAYYVLGGISQDMSSLFCTLLIEIKNTGSKERRKLDLYEREQIKALAIEIGDMFHQSPENIEAELLRLTDELETYREKLQEIDRPKSQRNQALIAPQKQKECMEFLAQPDLINRIDKLIEQAGVVGEENTRKLLFVVASTYKMKTPLHALVQGTSGSGKSHLINIIGNCIPAEDKMSMTRVTSKSFYHYNKEELVNKLMLIQDFDGMDEEAQYAFRELQSAGTITSSTIYKERSGNLKSTMKVVQSHFASMVATTKAELYYDTMSRSVIIGVDESEEQTDRIIQHQNKKLAGIIDEKDEQQASLFLQNCIRCIKPMEVINPYADKVNLPLQAKMLRRLNSHYQGFVKQITILHQYQRQKDEQGRLIAEPQDLQIACNILFDAIMLKVDELDTASRQLFDRLKKYIKEQAKEKVEYVFTQREARLALNMSKTSFFRSMDDLEKLEYVQKAGGSPNKGFKYKVAYWDDMEKIREQVKTGLSEQLAKLNTDSG